jgi:cardiolipin synthase C
VMGRSSLPSLQGRSVNAALTDTGDTRLGRAIATELQAHPGRSGIHPLPEATDAFAARVLLAGAAQRSLDVQYYIWHGDQTGMMLFEAAWLAAERGVRVRLLLDDINTGGLDETLAALDAHPNIELRLYNPFTRRKVRMLNFLTDFARVNRRMHNKSLTADNQATVIGGRNVGNEYFGAGNDVLFADLDVLAVGPVVAEVSQQFDLYWNSASAYPATGLTGAPAPGAAERLQAAFAAMRADPGSRDYLDAVRSARWIADMLAGRLEFEWTTVRTVHDDPAKTLASTPPKAVLMLPQLLQAMGEPQRGLDLISPYFVPGAAGTAAIAALARRGVRVRILTNSLAASDVAAVHAGYAKRRVELLQAGVQLFEFKPTGDQEHRAAQNREHKAPGGSSGASLHAKTFAVDRDRIFVGSFNFDPRSALLNTELGFVIASPALAGQLAWFFDTEVPKAAYEVKLPTGGRSLEWIERNGGAEERHLTEPDTGWLKRTGVGIMSTLPIDWLL